MKIIFLCSLIYTTLTLCSCNFLYNRLWDEFVKKYSKTFNSTKVEAERKHIWIENLIYIGHHNRRAKMGLENYWLGENALADYVIKMNNKLISNKIKFFFQRLQVN